MNAVAHGPVGISGALPGGSIEVVATDDAADIRLRLRRDPGPDALAIGHYLFRATNLRGRRCRFRILDVRRDAGARLAGREACEDGWTGTGPHVSYDGRSWQRLPGRIDGADYVFEHLPRHDQCFYARWAPYPRQRELDLVAAAQASGRGRAEVVGRSVQGRDLDLLTFGASAPGRRVCWVIARQHPSEAMASWFVEGLVERLLEPRDAAVERLLDRAVLHVVPDMNPDGVALGHTRANAAGANLNREWADPDPARSPEVWHVRRRMEQTGVDFSIDCHGDEELRCNFLGGPLNIPSRNPRLADLFEAFEQAWAGVTPDVQPHQPYPGGMPATADLRMAWNWIAERFDALSVLLEQPFKDLAHAPEHATGWSPERAKRLGHGFVDVLERVVDRFR